MDLNDFIKNIRNTKTMSQEREQYKKQLASLRQGLKVQLNGKQAERHKRNFIMKLIFIKMSGEEIGSLGKLESLRLMTSCNVIDKKIAYLGLCFLFEDDDEFFIMGTCGITSDLKHNNLYVVGMVLCALSQKCPKMMFQYLYKPIIDCMKGANRFIKKKAILCSVSMIKKDKMFVKEFTDVNTSLLKTDKNHGILLGVMAFMNELLQYQQYNGVHSQNMKQIYRLYKEILMQYNSQYEIGGIQDPFLQYTILRYIRNLRQQNLIDLGIYAEMLVMCHDAICSRININKSKSNSKNSKNGANGILLQCMRCLITLPRSQQLSDMIHNILSRFTDKDADSDDDNAETRKYLLLVNLHTIIKYDKEIVGKYNKTILECISYDGEAFSNKIAFKLLYLITQDKNQVIEEVAQRLLHTILNTSPSYQQFISQVTQTICLIVHKHNDAIWVFNTMLKLITIADTFITQPSYILFINIITNNSQIKQHCMHKIYQQLQQHQHNSTLCKAGLYLIGQLSYLITTNGSSIEQQQQRIIKIIHIIMSRQQLILVQYGLSALFKLYNSFSSQQSNIISILEEYTDHQNYEVQKRACEYIQILKWKESERKYVSTGNNNDLLQ